ncbi:MAG: sensor histidine kinase [Gaiellaceae bacterium]
MNTASGAERPHTLGAAVRDPVVAAIVVGGAATAVVVFVPPLHFAYRQQALHVALETSAALIGLLAAYLVLGRFRRSGRLDDFLLFYALGLMALGNLFFATIPAVVDGGSSRFATWASISGRLLGALAFAVAAFATQRRMRLTEPRHIAVWLSLPALVGAVAAAVAVFASRLPRGVDTLFAPEESGRPRLESEPVVLAAQLVAMALFVVAAIGFDRKHRQTGDDLVRWLAVAAVVAAFSRLHYFLYPSLYTEWVYTGDLFRLAFYVAILAAAAREISSYWRRVSQNAVLEERGRIARDLHDGLAQELAFIRRNLYRLDEEDRTVVRIKASIDRALADSRRAIAALTRPLDEPLESVLAEAAVEAAEREGTRVALDLSSGLDVDFERREALIRIACEAIANAARHGGAKVVQVELSNGEGVRLRVTDDGKGFDHDALSEQPHRGFGLVSMRERALALGGRFRVSSAPGQGTEVEVIL